MVIQVVVLSSTSYCTKCELPQDEKSAKGIVSRLELDDGVLFYENPIFLKGTMYFSIVRTLQHCKRIIHKLMCESLLSFSVRVGTLESH